MPLYAQLILPLDLKETYHYRVEDNILSTFTSIDDLIGLRVSVSFGRKRFYTGIICSIQREIPEGLEPSSLKSIIHILDSVALISKEQLQLWQWLSDYYCCSIGQVLRIAMPSGLCPESQTLVIHNPEFVAESNLSPLEYTLLDTLQASGLKGLKLEQLQNQFKQNISQAYTRLILRGAIYTEEIVVSRYRPRTKSYLQLCDSYRSVEGVQQALKLLERAKKQVLLFDEFLEALDPSHNPWDKPIARSSLSRGDSNRSALIKKIIDRGIWQIIEENDSRIRIPAHNSLPPPEHSSHSLSLPQGVSYLASSSILEKERNIIALVREYIQRGEQILLLSPSAHSFPYSSPYLNALEQATCGRTYYYHSFVSEAKRTELFLHLAQEKEACLVIGARSSVFLPFKRLALIIVDDEHEYLYKQQQVAPFYHARDVALYLGARNNIPILLCSSTPSAETLFNILRGKYHSLNTKTSSRPKALEELDVIDLKQERSRRFIPYDSTISLSLRQNIEKTLQSGKRVLLLQGRKGYAPYVHCEVCSAILKCPHCDLSLNYYASEKLLRCNYCKYNTHLPSYCPSCKVDCSVQRHNKSTLKLGGYGSQRVEEEIALLFPQAKTLRIDGDSLQSQKQRREIRERIDSGEVDIFVGTQLIKGENIWDKLGLIALVQLDSLIAYPDFRNTERSYQLLMQLINRSREYNPSYKLRIVIQTLNPAHPFIEQLRLQDYRRFIKEELSERQLMHFPPFTRLSIIRLKSFDFEVLRPMANLLSHLLRKHLPDISVSDAHSPSLARIGKQHIVEIVCRRPYSIPYTIERKGMKQADKELQEYSPTDYRKIKIQYDIDPL